MHGGVKNNYNTPVIVMTLGEGGGGDPGLTRVICQRVCDVPETICHSAFSRGWEIGEGG